jgi:hypothetical protein
MRSFTGLSTQSQRELGAELSRVISCTDASPTGGGAAIATKFKKKSLVVPEEIPAREECGCCGTGFVGMDPQRRVCQCARKWGNASARPCVSRSILRGLASELISLPRNLGNVSVALGTLSQWLVGLQGSRSRSRLTNWCRGTLAISSVKRGKHGWLRPKPTLLSKPSTGHQSAERFLEWQLVSSGMVINY